MKRLKDSEKPATPFTVLRGGRGPKTGVVVPDGLGNPRKLGAAREPPDVEKEASRDIVREANEKMLPDSERYPQEDEDDEGERSQD